MAKQIKHYVQCPKCESDQMAVADKVVGSNRVPMLFGHCKSCSKMLQGKQHQEYLAVPLVAEIVKDEPVAEVVEDFEPSEINHPVATVEEPKPAPSTEQKSGFRKVLKGLGITALIVLGVGTSIKLAQSS
jgi:nicotinamidase-related amidase